MTNKELIEILKNFDRSKLIEWVKGNDLTENEKRAANQWAYNRLSGRYKFNKLERAIIENKLSEIKKLL